MEEAAKDVVLIYNGALFDKC